MATKATRSNFYFVNPSEPLGTRDAYDGDAPARVFERTSWEWLYERYLRRMNVLSAIGEPRQEEYLAERKGVFRLHRLVPGRAYGVREPQLRPGFFAPDSIFQHEGHSVLPDAGEREKEGGGTEPTWDAFGTVMLARELGPAVAGMAAGRVGRASFLADAPKPKSTEATLSFSGESTSVPVNLNPAYDEPRESHATVSNRIERLGFDRTFFPVFRMVGDCRQDDAPEERTVEVWDSGKGDFVSRTAFLAPVRNPKEPSYDQGRGEFRKVTWDGGREDGYLELSPSSLSTVTRNGPGIPCVFGPGIREEDLGPCEYDGIAGTELGDGEYVPTGDYWHSRTGRKDVMGYLVPGDEIGLPEPRRGGYGVLSFDRSWSGGRRRAITHPSPRWDGGKPTCWAAWGFPHLDPRPASEVLGGQLAATCLPQPCVPPGFVAKLPAASDGSRDDAYGGYSDPGSARKRCPAAPACEPAEISRMLSRLDRTLVPADRVFARVSGFRRETYTLDDKGRTSVNCPPVHKSTRHENRVTTDELSGYFVGSFAELLWPFDPPGGLGDHNPQLPCDSTRRRESETRGNATHADLQGWYITYGAESLTVEKRSVDVRMSAFGVTPLRAGAGLRASPVRRHRENGSRGYNGETHPTTPVDRTTGGDYGPDLPPKDSALLLHPDVLAWAKSASLVAVFDVLAEPSGWGVRESSGSIDFDRHNDHSGSGATVLSSEEKSSGRRTSWRRLSVVTVGTMDLETCAVAEVDLLNLARRIYPSGARYSAWGDYDRRIVVTGTAPGCRSSSWRWGTTSHKDTYREAETHSFRVRSARLYVSVEWDFDRTDPPAPPGNTGIAGRIAAATAALSRAARLLERTKDWLWGAKSRVEALLAELAEFDMLPRQWDEEVGDAYSAARSAVAAFSSAVDGAKELVDAAEEAVLAAEGAAAAISEPPDPSDVSALESAAEAAEAAAQELSDAAYEALVADMDASTAVRALRGAQVAAGLDV